MPAASDHASRDAGGARFRRLRLGVIALGTLVVIAFVGSSAQDAWRAHQTTLTATDRELNNVAHALAEQTVWSLQAVDLLLLDTATWYRSEGARLADPEIDAALAARVAAVKQVRQITIMDSDGNLRHRSRALPTQTLNVADRSYFIAQRDDANIGMFMSEPLTTRSEGRAAVILSRRLEDEHGRFAGVVVANVDLEDLNQLYRTVDVGADSAVQLVRDDGTLLVRNPGVPAAVGRKFPALALLPEPAMTITNPIDGRADFIAVAPVRNAPLRIAVTRDAAAALKPWRDETIRLAIRTGIIVALSALTLVVMMRQIRLVATGQRALRESEERYALAMEGANEGHWDWDAGSDRLFLSARMRALFGEPAQADWTRGSAWLAGVPMQADDRPRFTAALEEHFAGRRPRFECEFRVRHGMDDWHWLLARGRCSFDPLGKPARFVGSALDVTAQKQAELDKERLESQLRQSQKMEAIGTLAGGIAHDFNNVLGAILGYGELAVQHAAQDPTLRRYLDNVMHAAERAKLLVERILGFSRSGLGDAVAVNVQAVVAETLELLAASLPAGIRIESSLTAGTAAVIGDPTYLHQVTMNLCANAIQAMEQGGVLAVGLERSTLSEPCTVSRGSLSPGDYVRLTIGDSGGGIAPEILERIFDPFFTTKGVGEGTGLGLSVVHGIVTDLGGGIDVSSQVGAGSRFTIWLPIAGEAPVPEREPSAPLPRGRGETLLIVDDERPLVELAEETVAGLGYEPVGFVSSRLALEAFRAAPERFDAVLTDESMPELVGTEFVRRIRSLRPSIPILLMSGHGDALLAARAAAAGVDEVLHKPLHGREIAEALARLLPPTR
jgi:signal transduction histidine kinase/CheY-like chemotaxis protein